MELASPLALNGVHHLLLPSNHNRHQLILREYLTGPEALLEYSHRHIKLMALKDEMA